MIEFLFIILIFNLSFILYLFNIINIINIYNLIIIPLIITKIILIFEKKKYLLCPKRFIEYDNKLNKKFLLYIFSLFIKNIKNIKNPPRFNINSRIIIDSNSEEE